MTDFLFGLLTELLSIAILAPILSLLWDWFIIRRPLGKLLGEFIHDGRLTIYFRGYAYDPRYQNSRAMYDECNTSAGLALGYIQNRVLDQKSLPLLGKQILVEVNDPLPAQWESFIVVGFEHPQAQVIMSSERQCPIRRVDGRFVLKHGLYQITVPSDLSEWREDELSDGFIAKFSIAANGADAKVLLIGGTGPNGNSTAAYYLWRNWRKLVQDFGSDDFVCHLQVPPGYSYRQPRLRYQGALGLEPKENAK